MAFFWLVKKTRRIFGKNWNDAGAGDFLRSAHLPFASEKPAMNGLAKTNSADGKALFVLVTAPRPIGLTSKRVADIVLSLCGIVLLAPFLILCYVATACFSP